MYDAKKSDKSKNEEIKYGTIYDRAYFNKSQGDNFISTKTAYIPAETLLFK
jgi:hypothetical protein